MVVPALVGCLHRAQEQCPPCAPEHAFGTGVPRVAGVPEPMLRKAAAYDAATAAAFELQAAVPFSEWLHGSLLAEIGCDAPHARPVRRAAVRLLAAWVPQLAEGDRPAVYEALLNTLRGGGGAAGDSALLRDGAVALAAVQALHALIDDWCVHALATSFVVLMCVGMCVGVCVCCSR